MAFDLLIIYINVKLFFFCFFCQFFFCSIYPALYNNNTILFLYISLHIINTNLYTMDVVSKIGEVFGEEIWKEQVIDSELTKAKESAEAEKEDNDEKEGAEVEKEDNDEKEGAESNQEEATEEFIWHFAIKTHEKMKQLGITSLNITQTPREITLKTEKQIYNLSPNNKKEITPIISQNMLLKKSHSLSGPAIKIGQMLHQLLLNLNRLPVPAPMMNPSKFEKPDFYNQALLRKLEKGLEFSDDDDCLLNVNNDVIVNLQHQIEDDDNITVISEVDLLKKEDEMSFNFHKEEVIKILSCRIGKIYNKIVEEYVEEEEKRRSRFRSYVDILIIQRKIEIYCSLYKTRNKGKTIKSQSKNKVLSYNPKITSVDLKMI